MCARYDNLIAREALKRLFGVDQPATNFPPRYNIAPTDDIPIIRVTPDGERELLMARWGLIPFWMKEKPRQPFINARAETVHSAPMFRDAFRSRRCLVPATGFYEWQHRASGKQPYRFRRADLDPFAFAGLWEGARVAGERLVSAAIIVGEPNPLVAAVHDRMPVILLPDDYECWLDPGASPDTLRALLRPFPAELMEVYAVSRKVNSVKADGEELIAPVDDDGG